MTAKCHRCLGYSCHVATTWACCAALYSYAGHTDSTDRSYSKCHRVVLPLQIDWRDGYVPMNNSCTVAKCMYSGLIVVRLVLVQLSKEHC